MVIALVLYYISYFGFEQIFGTYPVVNTSCGNVQGRFNGIGYSFKGIPYAVPPIGNRRWQPPVPLNYAEGSCWKNTHIALEFGNTCMQREPSNPQKTLGSEDCLYLNVWTPTINVNANLPVMVWIHGGGLQEFNANWPTYCPTEELAKDTNMVYVGMNYRLNAFGFMTLDILSAHSPHNTSGNYGFMDQILAMRWTKENIQNFGGDPNQILEAVPWNVYPYWAMSDQQDLPRKNHFDGAIAVVDGYVVEKPPFQAWKDRTALDVPLLIGTTAQETDFAPVHLDMKSWTWSDYQKQVYSHLSTFGMEIVQKGLKLYPAATHTPEYQYTSMGADIRVGCPNDVMTQNAAIGSENPVYRYVVTSIPSSSINVLGMPFPSSYSFHMWDMFAYGYIKDYIKPPGESDILFQTNIRREVLSFVKTGKPFSKNWLPFPQSTALLSRTTNVTQQYHMSQCEFWLINDFFNYAWIN